MLTYKIIDDFPRILPSDLPKGTSRLKDSNQVLLASTLRLIYLLAKDCKKEAITVMGIGSGNGSFEKALFDITTGKILEKHRDILDHNILGFDWRLLKELKVDVIASDLDEKEFAGIDDERIIKIPRLNVLDPKALTDYTPDIVVANRLMHHIFTTKISQQELDRSIYEHGLSGVVQVIEAAFSAGATYVIGNDNFMSEGDPFDKIILELKTDAGQEMVNDYLSKEKDGRRRCVNFQPLKISKTSYLLPRIIRDDFLNFSSAVIYKRDSKKPDLMFDKAELHLFASPQTFGELAHANGWHLEYIPELTIVTEDYAEPDKKYIEKTALTYLLKKTA